MVDLSLIEGFNWDTGNATKSETKHAVSQREAEQVFLNQPLIITDDLAHSGQELRMQALGKTLSNRCLHISFTLRAEGTLIRVISARDMSKKERKQYEEAR
jgi:uncharacterized protein